MEKIKGRPSLPAKRQKRLHYSVWLNEEQKQKIDERISKSNLSASQYILAQLELVPVKLPALANAHSKKAPETPRKRRSSRMEQPWILSLVSKLASSALQINLQSTPLRRNSNSTYRMADQYQWKEWKVREMRARQTKMRRLG